MSVKVAQNQAGAALLSGVVSSLTQPYTICSFVKVVAYPASGFTSINLLRFGGGTGYSALGFSRNSSTVYNISAFSNDGSVDAHASVNIFADPLDWKACFGEYASATSRTAYTTLSGSEASTNNTTNRNPSGVVDITLMNGTWTASDYYAAYIKVYSGTLTLAQRDEYRTSGTIAALTPLFELDLDTDWGVGDLTATGSYGTTFTPPASWSYSADMPTFSASPSITSVNGGTDSVQSNSSFSYVVSDFTGSLTSGDIEGTALTGISDTGATLPALIDGAIYPKFNSADQTLTLNDDVNVESAQRTITVTPPSGYSIVTAASPITDNDKYLGYWMSPTPVTSDQVGYVIADCTVSADLGVTTDTSKTTNIFHRVESTGVIYTYTLIINEYGVVLIPRQLTGENLRGTVLTGSYLIGETL